MAIHQSQDYSTNTNHYCFVSQPPTKQNEQTESKYLYPPKRLFNTYYSRLPHSSHASSTMGSNNCSQGEDQCVGRASCNGLTHRCLLTFRVFSGSAAFRLRIFHAAGREAVSGREAGSVGAVGTEAGAHHVAAAGNYGAKSFEQTSKFCKEGRVKAW